MGCREVKQSLRNWPTETLVRRHGEALANQNRVPLASASTTHLSIEFLSSISAGCNPELYFSTDFAEHYPSLSLSDAVMAETNQSDHSHATRVRKERRKIRKGTQSCWECKRRKIRCTFASPREVICEPCKLRGSSCVSQELPEQLEPSSSRASRAERRLDRLEAMMERTLQSSGHYNTDGSIHEEQGHGSQLQGLIDDFPNIHNNFVEDGVLTSPQSSGAVDQSNRAASVSLSCW